MKAGGTGLACVRAKLWGLLARSLAMMTHSLVVGSCLISDIFPTIELKLILSQMDDFSKNDCPLSSLKFTFHAQFLAELEVLDDIGAAEEPHTLPLTKYQGRG